MGAFLYICEFIFITIDRPPSVPITFRTLAQIVYDTEILVSTISFHMFIKLKVVEITTMANLVG